MEIYRLSFPFKDMKLKKTKMQALSGVNLTMKCLAWCQVQSAANSLICVSNFNFFFKENTFLNVSFYSSTTRESEIQSTNEWVADLG